MSALAKLTPMFLANAAFCIENGSDVKPETRESIIDTLIKASEELSQANAAKIAPTQGADARPVADAREALTDSVVEKWLDSQGNDSGQGLCDMYTSAVRDGYRLARSTLTDFYATRDAATSDAPNAWADLWYFVMDEAPMEFERIVTTVSPKQWHSEAHKLMRAKYPIAPREKT